MNKPIWKRWWVIAAAVVAVVLLIAVNGNDDPGTPAADAPAEQTTPAEQTSPAAAGEAEEAVSECLAVPDEVAQHLALALHDDARAVAAAAVKPGDSWVVAVEVAGGPFNGDRAVFETLNIETPSLLQAVDGFAREFTNLPDSAYSIADQPAVDALACLP